MISCFVCLNGVRCFIFTSEYFFVYNQKRVSIRDHLGLRPRRYQGGHTPLGIFGNLKKKKTQANETENRQRAELISVSGREEETKSAIISSCVILTLIHKNCQRRNL